MRTGGRSVAGATALFGVSRPTFYKVQSDFDRSGLVGLLPAKRGPRGPHKITSEVARFIEEAAVSREDLDGQRLAERIAQRLGLAVHQRTVKRALARLEKKSAVNPGATSLDGPALGARHEALRQGIVDKRGCRHMAPGLVLFMRKGMAAWMKSVGEGPVRDAAIRVASSTMHMPEGIERDLVDMWPAWLQRRWRA